MLVLDSGGLTRLAHRSQTAAATILSLQAQGQWPPAVPTMVLVESVQGKPGRDANVNRFLKACVVRPQVSETLARRAAELRRRAGQGSAVDALVVASAEPGGVVLTGDTADIEALAAHARNVDVVRI